MSHYNKNSPVYSCDEYQSLFYLEEMYLSLQSALQFALNNLSISPFCVFGVRLAFL